MPPILQSKRPKDLKDTLKKFLHYLGKHKILLLIIAILVTLSALANLLGTYMFQPIIDNFADPNSDLAIHNLCF